MWLTSKTPAAWRTALCSSMIPEYWTGMSHPPKSTILAPSARWTEFKGVDRRAGAADMKTQANSTGTGVSIQPICTPAHAAREKRDATGLRTERHGGTEEVGLKEPRGMERLEAVSDAENGLDVLIGIAAQFLAEPAHVDVECARADLGAVAPDLHQKRFARDDFARVLHQ